MKKIITAIALLTLASSAPAAEQPKKTNPDILMQSIASSEIQKANEYFKTWVAPEVLAESYHTRLTDTDVKSLYKKFTETIVTPPNPDNMQEYSIENGTEKLDKVDKLGRTVNSLLMSLPMEDLEKYGYLLQSMRDVLYLDAQHIPLAIRHDRSRDFYWFALHVKWTGEAAVLYEEMLG